MRKLLPLLLAIIFAILQPSSMRMIYASQTEETDMFGNPIDWERNAYGGDDIAGEEIIDENVSGEAETYSFGEQVDILKEIEKYETSAPSETGYITITFPESEQEGDWNKGNILVEIARGAAIEEIWLYRQSGWESRKEIPVGHYTFFQASTSDGSYSFSSNINSFDITQNGNVSLSLSLGVTTPAVEIKGEENESLGTEAREIVSNKCDEENKFRPAIVLVLIGTVIVFGGIILLRRKSALNRPGYRNDLLD